jgi:ABC-type glycerol-3-phosphate transport system substrate-binding protein
MGSKRLSRRDFLRLTAMGAAGSALAGCAPRVVTEEVEKEVTREVEKEVTREVEQEVEKEVTREVEKVITATPEPAPEPVTLEIRLSNPEYANGEEQIWQIYLATNPHVTMEFFSVSEGASVEAYNAKVAGGWVPAMDWWVRADNTNYQEYLNQLETGFPWFDNITYDIRNAFKDRYGLDQPYVTHIQVQPGFLWTYQYHADLMEEAGLDPQNDVKSWDDMKEWLTAGTEWAAATDGIDHFWDQSSDCVWCFTQLLDCWPLAFPNGGLEQQRKAWTGEIPMTSAESPYRPVFEFLVEAYNEGWMPKEWWARTWEADMEASYISKRSVMMQHGPWVWDKALAADPTVQQAGLPNSPPADGQDTWLQCMGSVNPASGAFMWAAAMDQDWYEEAQKAFNWWFSPQPMKLLSELWGQPFLYGFPEGEEPDLSGPQYDAIWSKIATEGSPFENVEWSIGDKGSDVAAKYQTDDAINWDQWEWNSELLQPLCTGEITVDEALAWFETEIERNHDLPS